MALSHPNLPSEAREIVACDYFVDRLDDPEVALKVRERNPSNLDDAVRIALQLEARIRDVIRQKAHRPKQYEEALQNQCSGRSIRSFE